MPYFQNVGPKLLLSPENQRVGSCDPPKRAVRILGAQSPQGLRPYDALIRPMRSPLTCSLVLQPFESVKPSRSENRGQRMIREDCVGVGHLRRSQPQNQAFDEAVCSANPAGREGCILLGNSEE